jgi:hypothetical protein
LAEAEHIDAPTLSVQNGQITAAWVGADDSGVHHDTRAYADGQLSPTVVLPLPPIFPHSSRLVAAGGRDSNHLLWLDLDRQGVSQLYSALIDGNFGVYRGPLAVSTTGAVCFDLLPQADGTVWVIWRGGDGQNPTVHTALLEQTGLRLQAQQVMTTRGCPQLVSTYNGDYAVWEHNDSLLVGRFLSGRIANIEAVGALPPTDTDTLRRPLLVGSDGEQLYAFWNITRADGSDQTWYTSGQADAPWSAPAPLAFATDENNSIDTTLNSGNVSAATSGTTHTATWAAPARQLLPILPVAVQVNGGTLGVLYFDAGAIVGYQRVIDVPTLLGVPALVVDSDRHLTLAWSEPLPFGASALNFTTTRR